MYDFSFITYLVLYRWYIKCLFVCFLNVVGIFFYSLKKFLVGNNIRDTRSSFPVLRVLQGVCFMAVKITMGN